MSAAIGNEKPWRLFVAALLSDANRRALGAPIAQLASLTLVNPSRPDAIHLTLHFLGPVSSDRVDEISRGLLLAVRPFPAFVVEVTGVGAFPSLSRPRVLWAGIDGPERKRLGDLQLATGVALRAARMPVESRPYAPHLTLARLRDAPRREDRAAILGWAAQWKDASFGALLVDGLHLVRSDLGARPPRYTTLESFPLQ